MHHHNIRQSFYAKSMLHFNQEIFVHHTILNIHDAILLTGSDQKWAVKEYMLDSLYPGVASA